MRRLTSLAPLVLPLASRAGADVPSLDPRSYVEPADAAYWGRGAQQSAPFTEERLQADDLDKKGFEERVLDGRPFVVEGVGLTWPMRGWDCDFFRTDPTFARAELSQQYAEGGRQPFVPFSGDWQAASPPSGAGLDPDAPKLAPFYWGIKDVQHEDAQRSATWTASMLHKVKEHIRLPQFMDSANEAAFGRTPEFWFAASGGGAKAHMDTHVETTVSIQLAGTKRWRMRFMDERRAPFLAMTYADGDVYDAPARGDKPWAPHYNVTLRPGDALFVPPGFIHETLNVGNGEGTSSEADACSASVTFQFDVPHAARLYRRFLPRVLRTADIHEAWPLIRGWATLHHARAAPKEGMPYTEARAQAMGSGGAGTAFRHADANADGFLSSDELRERFGAGEASSVAAFHDLNGDGRVSRAEFAEVFGLWAGACHEVSQDVPNKYKKYLVRDLEGDFNIEDLNPKIQRDILQRARALEASRREGGGRASEL